jgi:DinB superfamily
LDPFSSISTENFTPERLLMGRDQVLHQMQWARQYTRQLIDSVPYELWYKRPGDAPSHIAWQVGHLSVAQYGLMLFRQRGRMPGDLEIMPGWLRKQFGKGTVPSESEAGMPAPHELLDLMDKIDRQSQLEARQYSAQLLSEPTEMPYAAYPIKLGALLFCPIHEALHAGQIGVLRRLLGLAPLR